MRQGRRTRSTANRSARRRRRPISARLAVHTAIAAFLLALVWPAAASGVQVGPEDQYALSNDAMNLQVVVRTESQEAYCEGAPQDVYNVQFIDPGSVLEANGPKGRPGEADLREPWVAFEQQRQVDPNGCGSWGRLDVSLRCAVFANVANYEKSIGSEPEGTSGPAIRVSFDVRGCEDGKGYDFYRVSFEGNVYRFGDSDVGGLQGWGPSLYGSSVPGHWHGLFGRAASTGNTIAGQQNPLSEESASRIHFERAQVCGHADSEVRCYSTDNGVAVGRKNLQGFFATAHPPE